MSEITDLVPSTTEEHGGIIATTPPLSLLGRDDFATTLDRNVPANREILYRALGRADFQGSDVIGQDIDLVDMVLQPVTLTSKETGEMTEAVRSVLIDSEGKTYAFVSLGILQDLQKINSVIRGAPWNPPIRVRPMSKTTGGKNRWYYLELVDENPSRRAK